jgi:putative endopeptidase
MNRTLIRISALAGLGLFALALKIADEPKAIDKSNFDTSVRPQDDFFSYVNGTWLKNNPIPATETSWGNFNVLNEKSQKALRSICETAAANKTAKPGTNQQRIGDFFASGMDSTSIETMKFAPIKPEFDKIIMLKDVKGLTALFAEMHQVQSSAGFGYFVMADQKNSNVNAAYLYQSGIGLPEKDYYFSEDTKGIREEYVKHITNLFVLLGDEEKIAFKNAGEVFELEKALAGASMGAVELRDAERQYNKMSVESLSSICGAIDWKSYFTLSGTPTVKEVIVAQPEFMKMVNTQMTTTPIATWKNYFRWHLVHLVAGKLHKAVADEHFRFYGTVLSGQTKQQPRWKRVMSTTEGALGEALGEEYVKTNFSATSKKRVDEMVTNLTAAFEERIQTREWMSPETKAMASKKLGTIMRKLAYPDKWRNYSGLKVDRKSYVRNYLNSNRFDAKYFLDRLGKPVDKTEWGMTPATINAYYNPSYNEIVFPAAIMQPPFFDPNADDAVNYGAMGAIIGHELTHGFDDEGSHYDSEGNLVDWWTADDRSRFEELTKKLSAQFSSFVVIDSLNLRVNGDLTLGENIADLGGLTISYYAYQRSLKGEKGPEIDGFTGNQRFFISWAQGWRTSMRTRSLINMVKTNPHSPARFRVLGPLSNMQEFYDAFNVKEGDKMYRSTEDRVAIW